MFKVKVIPQEKIFQVTGYLYTFIRFEYEKR